MTLDDLLPRSTAGYLGDAFKMMEWADDEIDAARLRHPQTDPDVLHGAFHALRPGELFEELRYEVLFRAHCRELLDRLAAGKDISPATDAEILAVLKVASLRAPMAPGLACLYFRICARSFPELWAHMSNPIDREAYESIHGSDADDHERYLRHKLTRKRDGGTT